MWSAWRCKLSLYHPDLNINDLFNLPVRCDLTTVLFVKTTEDFKWIIELHTRKYHSNMRLISKYFILVLRWDNSSLMGSIPKENTIFSLLWQKFDRFSHNAVYAKDKNAFCVKSHLLNIYFPLGPFVQRMWSQHSLHHHLYSFHCDLQYSHILSGPCAPGESTHSTFYTSLALLRVANCRHSAI